MQHSQHIDLEAELAALEQVIPPGQPCHIEQDIAELIAAEFSPWERYRRARKAHKRTSHLRPYLVAA